MSSQSPVTRIGIVGTGMISRCLARLISRHYDDMTVTRVLTRRPIATGHRLSPARAAHPVGG
ncbi:glyceraldehyde-3-phosphate dehydrogenase/erythrose-4-phosphate dehydrogenase [Pseudomonas psychrotolerans]|nr:glyceraldehyde-3-phosphate dehydrogenase/erythrose-4-phosphate dehydrogenase [Pseudomonas psychrotolerans]